MTDFIGKIHLIAKFYPGQGLPMFNGEELLAFVEQATWVAVNDYEGQLLQERTGLSPEQIAERVEALVVTRGAEGSYVYTNGKRIDIPQAKAAQLSDPTGCGDAFRAGLLFGLMRDLDWEITGRIASLMGAIKIEQHGTQNHRFTRSEFASRFQDAFDMSVSDIVKD